MGLTGKQRKKPESEQALSVHNQGAPVGALKRQKGHHTGERAMPAKAIIDAYFQAFNRHNPDAVAALFSSRGTYVDPAVSSGIKGEALKGYLRGHYVAFPDARYRVRTSVVSRDGLMACEWRFTGTNAGPLGDKPATNRAVDVRGASVLQVKNGKITWLHGYYDRRNMLKRLGIQGGS
jgi:steroid delta-isomerase-like uncharacterized protein